MRRLRRAHGAEPLWEDGEPTEEAHTIFTEGDCWALAWSVALLTGGHPTTLGDWPGWEHVVVDLGPEHGERRYIDVEGLHTGADLEADWSVPLHRMADEHVASLSAYTRALDASFVFGTHHGEVAEFARLLVGKHVGPLRRRAAA